MANFDFKTETPDATFPSGGFLFGADSQSASTPSIYAGTTYLAYILGLANTWTAAQTISVNGAVSAPGFTGTGTWYTGGSATTTKPYVLFEPTGTTSTGWSTSGTGLGVNAAAGFGGNLLDLQVAASPKFLVKSSGNITIGGSWNDFTFTVPSGGGSRSFSIAEASGTMTLAVASGQIVGNGAFALGSSVSTPDVYLYRDAAATLALRNGTNAQTFRVYNTESSSLTNYERLAFYANSNIFYIGPQAGGTGSVRTLGLISAGVICAGADSGFRITGSNLSTIYWYVNPGSGGHLLAGTDNTYDIGASGATRPRNIWAAGTINAAGQMNCVAINAGAGNIANSGTSNYIGTISSFFFKAASDGVVELCGSGLTGSGFGRLMFGGTTSSFPALKRSSTVLQARLADDSDFAPLQGKLRTEANAVAETPTATHTMIITDAGGTAYRVLCVV